MRFLLGVLVGYTLLRKTETADQILATLALVVYVIVPAIALLGLSIDVQRERRVKTSSNQGASAQRTEP